MEEGEKNSMAKMKVTSYDNLDRYDSKIKEYIGNTISSDAAPKSHSHGNITSSGTLQTNDIAVANGDKIVVTDSSDSAKVARTSISFDGSTATKALTQKGTWETFGTSNLTIGTTADKAAAGNHTHGDASTSSAGFMTTAQVSKLNGIANGAEVNQNAFSNVKVGTSTIVADGKTDTFELIAGSNITLTPDTTNDAVTITATDTTYNEASTSTSGLMSSSDKTKLNGISTGAEVNQNAFSNVKVGSTTVAADAKTDTLELAAGSNITLTPDATNDKVTIAATDTNTTYEFATGDSNGQIKVTPSGGTAYNVNVKGLQDAAYKSVTTSVTSGSADLVTSGAVYTAIDNLPNPMVLKGSLGTTGTITQLPTDGSANIGDTYKVITAGTYAGTVAKIGDFFSCLTKTSSVNTWEYFPSGDEIDTWRNIKVNGTELLGNPISTGAVNFKNGSNVTVTGSVMILP